MSTQSLGEIYPNSDARASGKTGNSAKRPPALILAADLARAVRISRSWPTLQSIRQAIEDEAEDSGITIEQAAALIAHAAMEIIPAPQYSVPQEWSERLRYRNNILDRFWFEDQRWRSKKSYWKLLESLEEVA